MIQPHGHGLLVAVSFLSLWSLYTFCGLLIAKVWLVPSAAFDMPDFLARWRQMLQECLALLTVAGVLLLLVRTAQMDDSSVVEALPDVPIVLTKTHFGLIWCIHLMALGLLWVCCSVFSAGRSSNRWMVIAVGGTLLLAFTYSASSHASDRGDFTLSELNDWFHIISTSLWGGAILVSAIFVLPILRTQGSLMSLIAIRLSNLSGVALVLVLATGVGNVLLRLPSWDALTGTGYGRVLMAKLFIVGVMILIGAFNRFALISRIQRRVADPSFPIEKPVSLIFRALMVDTAFVVVAMMLAAFLIQNESY